MKSRLYYLTIILFLCPYSMKSQDLIILKNGKDTIKCKILEDKILFLKYQNFKSKDTIVYQISQNDFDYYLKQTQENNSVLENISTSKAQTVISENKIEVDTLQYFKKSSYIPFYYFNVGLGVGMSYGGIGTRLTYNPIKYISIFAAGGYALIGFGFNAGISIKPLPKEKICPYISAMYGYNAVIQITGINGYGEFYYGPTFSIGVEFRFQVFKNFINAELLIPIRSHEFYTELDEIKKNKNIKMNSEPPPIGICLGYHFVF